MNRMLCITLSGLVFLIGGCAGAASDSVKTLHSADELKTVMASNSPTVVHALNQEDYEKGHIPNAVNIDYEQMSAADLPDDKAAPLVFYCVGGMCPVGGMAANKAAGYGYTNVWVYRGGLKDWRSANEPVVTGPNPR